MTCQILCVTIVCLIRTIVVVDVTVSTFDNMNVTEVSEIPEVTIFENATCDVANTTCDDANLTSVSGEFETTSKYNVGAIGLVPTTPKPKILSKIKKSFSIDEMCTCDLQQDSCDINCCCDEDCTYKDKLIFDRCDSEPNRIYDTRYCKYSMYIYKNNTPYEWEVNQNGLFCIVKDNLPPEYSVHEAVKLYNSDDAKLQKINKYGWRSVEVIEEIPWIRFNESLRYGDYMWIIRNKTGLEVLEIPSSFETDACLVKTELKYLENIRTNCVQTNLNSYNRLLDINAFITNVTLVSFSTEFNPKVHLQNCPKNICIPIEAKICDEGFQHCNNITNDTNIYRFSCNISLYDNTYVCSNLLKKIKYVISHNGTQGLNKVEVFFNLSSRTFNLQEATLFWQEFDVEYVWANKTSNFSSKRSGNPGYIVGKPIILGNLVEHNQNGKKQSPKNISIERDPLDASDNFLTLPENRGGKCVLKEESNIPIEFGYNVVFTCKFVDSIQTKNTSSQKLCAEIQKSIFKLWGVKNLHQNITRVFGKFGNANVNKLDDWANITYNLQPESLLGNIKSNFSQKFSKINCQNLYDVLKIDVFHAREVVKNLHNQEKLLWLMFTFANGQNRSFGVSNGSVELEFYLRFEIVFYDVTTKKSRKFVDPPSLDIKLPYDFFYPFVKLGNGCDKIINFSYFLFIYMLSFTMNKIQYIA